jgi:hypothetical protein
MGLTPEEKRKLDEYEGFLREAQISSNLRQAQTPSKETNVERQVMAHHLKILGVIYIVLGLFSSAIATIYMVTMGVAARSIETTARSGTRPESGVVAALFGSFESFFVLIAIFGAVEFAVGVGLLSQHPLVCVRFVGMLLVCIILFVFSIGTAVGSYVLWLLLSRGASSLFNPFERT